MTLKLESEMSEKEYVSCSVCGDEQPTRTVFEISGFKFGRCPRCGLLRVNPRLKAAGLENYYDDDYWKSNDSVTKGYSNYFADAENIRKTFHRRIKSIVRAKMQAGRWLDVGCASGFLLQETMAQGWDCHGVEWSEYAIANADPKVKSRIWSGTLQQYPGTVESFDVITLWDYLEHSPDPRADMVKAKALLKSGGSLSIIIPDAGSLLARLMGQGWEEYKKPQEHLYFFTATQLVRLVSEIGFTVLKKQRAGKYASLQFAFSRFKPGDGVLYSLARIALAIGNLFSLSNWVVYINPGDKLHLICRKQ